MSNITRKRILLTGATGLCGRAIAAKITERADLFNLFTTSRSTIKEKNHIIHELSQPLLIGNKGFPEQIDLIIHTAATVDENAHGFDIIKTNLEYAYNVCVYAKKAKANNIFNLSSMAVYGSPYIDKKYNEYSDCYPITDYGLSKLLTEKLFETYLSEKANVVNLRLGYVLNKGIPNKYFLSRLFNSLLQNKTIKLINADKSRITFIDSRDIGNICFALENIGFSGNINITCGESPTVQEIFKIIHSLVPHSQSQICKINSDALSIRAKYDNSQLLVAFNDFKPISWQESIIRALNGVETKTGKIMKSTKLRSLENGKN